MFVRPKFCTLIEQNTKYYFVYVGQCSFSCFSRTISKAMWSGCTEQQCKREIFNVYLSVTCLFNTHVHLGLYVLHKWVQTKL